MPTIIARPQPSTISWTLAVNLPGSAQCSRALLAFWGAHYWV